MLSRGRSKERNRTVTPPGPVYMSNDQFANYLSDLRNNRVARPSLSGARPQPASNKRDSGRSFGTITSQHDESDSSAPETAPRSGSALSHRRADLAMSQYASVTSRTGRQLAQQPMPPQKDAPAILKPSEVVPTDTYMERGLRWMEKEEAVSLREAMEDMDLKKQEEESRVHSAAQEEASELVWQHQHPTAAVNPDAPYRYNDHLRKNSYQHARTQSVGRYGGIGVATGLARDMGSRSTSGSSNTSGGRGRMSLDLTESHPERALSPGPGGRASLDSAMGTGAARKCATISTASTRPGGSRRRSSVRRNVSGEFAGIFTGSQIWEEPEQEDAKEDQKDADRGRAEKPMDMPAPLRIKPRNPLNRVQFAIGGPRSSSTPPAPMQKLSTSEIYRNPPTQSRNPNYTANPSPAESPVPDVKPNGAEEAPAVPMKDGLEIRSDELRQATSMRLKDRSPKLPTPTVVSDRPGRPIVSFDSDWKPKEADVKPEVRRRSPFDRRPNGQRESVPYRPGSKDDPAPISTVRLPEPPSVKVSTFSQQPVPTIHRSQTAPPIPIISLPSSVPPISVITFPDSQQSIPIIDVPDSKPSIPVIDLPDSKPRVPAINLDGAPSITVSGPSVPTINLPDAPSILVSAPTVPTITIGGPATTKPARPLPTPAPSAGRPQPRHHATAPIPRGHWSPAPGRRATATCHQCQLPIEGRVVKLSGAPEHFHPECFICFTCGTGLESLEIHPEPPPKRIDRVDRIKRRARGEEIPEVEGQTYAEDGDERLRFYCHLDWHESFAPRCKHCTTPIIGEHMVALGDSWHYGHFFCAECGDPFEKGMTHIEKDGYAWCLRCQTKRTERRAPKCKKCRGPVIGEYVQALGGEWHEKCFRCATCKNSFHDGAFYPKQVDGETVVLCIGCIERELKA